MYKKLGIVGGMGTFATITLFRRIYECTAASCDQDYINTVILNDTTIPDRTEAILYGGASPIEQIVKDCGICISAECDIIAIPCNTSHYYFDEIQKQCSVPIINMIDEVALALQTQGIKTAFLSATSGTVKTGVYDKYLSDRDITTVLPDDNELDTMMKLIYTIKANGNYSGYLTAFTKIAGKYISQGCEKIILGCTELSTVREQIIKATDAQYASPHSFIIDSTEVLKDKILLSFNKQSIQ